MGYEYFIGDLFFVVLWFILYFLRKDLRKEMIFSSLLCMPFGLSDLIFIPHYWNPNRLFDLRLGIESFIFAFSIGGIAAVLYEIALNKHLAKAREKRIETKRHYYILFGVVISSLILFSFIFKYDLIYAGIIAMALGAISIIFSRKDLIRETILGGILFLVVYFLLLFIINTFIFPDIIARTWNFENLWGITILKIPLEEILWALTFGALWAPVYEDIKGYALK